MCHRDGRVRVCACARVCALPKTTCLPSSHAVLTVQMKNWEPLVPGPALAIERMPGPVCFSLKFSSANFSP